MNDDLVTAEYTALRNEILHFLTFARQYQLTGTASIALLFWWSVEHPSLIYPEITLLFVYTVVLLTYFLMRKRRAQARRASTYIAIFLENSVAGNGWENKLDELTRGWERSKIVIIQEDFILSVFLGIVGLLVYSQWISAGRWNFDHVFQADTAIIFESTSFLIFLAILISIHRSFSKVTTKFIEQWNALKDLERK